MTLKEFLESSYDYRISLGRRWMVREIDGTWTVYDQPYGRRVTKIVDCVSEQAAVFALTNQDES